MTEPPNEAAPGMERDAAALADEVRRLRRAIRAREALLAERERQLAEKTELVKGMLASRSWRLTRPLRAGSSISRRVRAIRAGDDRRRALEQMFDARWYAENYGVQREDLLGDYLAEGWRRGRSPAPLLDNDWYAAEYRDRLDGRSPLEDYVAHPYERRPNRWFDPMIWRRTPDRPGSDVVAYLGSLEIAADDPRSRRPGGEAVLQILPGARSLDDGHAACVFAHYDPDHRFDAHVVSTLAALAQAGRRIVVCSTSDVDAASCEPVLEHVAWILSVPNSGHDWGAYHAGLEFVLDRSAPCSVDLMNDSVYVLDEALAAFLERADSSTADVVGATDSLMYRYHLQSYFLRLRRSALTSPLVEEFLATYVPVSEKHYVINAYEIGFSARAIQHGLALDPVFAFDDLVAATPDAGARSEFAPNPTLELWDALLERGSPFVKAQLLRDMSPDPHRVRELVPPETHRRATAHLERAGARIAAAGRGIEPRSVDAAAHERP